MSKDKQIDEIAKLTCTYPQCIHYNIIGECASTECQTVYIAENLYDKGYRKASEIFEEIDTVFDEMIDEATGQLSSARLECDLKAVRIMEYGIDVLRLAYRTLEKSLKKKYTEEGK